MTDTRRANKTWSICEPNDSGPVSFDAAQLAVLQDIRDELQTIRRLAECHNVRAGFIAMQRLEKRWRKKKRSVK